MAFFYKTPRCTQRKMFNVADVVDDMPAFNAHYALTSGNINKCNDLNQEEKLRWLTWMRETAINCGGEETELDFFEKDFNGNKKKSGATDVYIRYNCDRDFNIFAENTVQGAGPGQAVNFVMARALHTGNGAWSPIAKNGHIYIYEDQQWLRITNVDKTTPYAHVVTAVPFSKYYTPNVRGKKKMMFTRVRMVDGYSCAIPSSAWDAPGFALKVKPFRARADWEVEIDLLRPFQDKLRFALTYDLLGNQVDSFEMMETTRARQEFMYQKNMIFFMGQKIDNPALIGSGNALRDDKYSGFDGVLPSLRFGGGFVQETDTAVGYDLDTQFDQLMIRQDALKESNEFFTIAGFRWLNAMIKKNGELFKNAAGACTFESFVRSGKNKADIERLGITSYRYLDFTLHFKRAGWMTDERSIGNYNMPWLAIMMPGVGLKDENGDAVSAIEFYEAGGTSEAGTYREDFIDWRKHPNSCEKMSGSITETYQMAVNCPKKWVLLWPKFRA